MQLAIRNLIVGVALLSVTAFFTVSAPSGAAELKAYYPFNGNANDESGNGHNGTVYGATLCPDRFGVADRAYEFNGIGYIAVANSPTVTTSATFAAWVYLNSGGTGGYVIIKGTYLVPETYSIVIFDHLGKPPKLQARVYVDGNYLWATGEQDLPVNTWTHVAGVYDGSGSGLTLYVNGEYAASQAFSGELHQNSEPLVFGGDVGNPESFIQGRVDDIRIYDSALSQTDIRAMMVPEPGTIALLAPALLGIAGTLRGKFRNRR